MDRSQIHLVIVCLPAYGHVRPLRSLATRLAAQGHPMTFITGSVRGPSVREIPGVDFVPFTGEGDWDLDRLDEAFPARKQQPQDATLPIWDLEHIFLAGLDSQVSTIASVLERPSLADKKVVLLHDGLTAATMPFFLQSPHLRRVPLIAIAPIPILFLSKDTMPFGSGLPSQGETKNAEANALATKMFAAPSAKMSRVLEKYRCAKRIPHAFPFSAWALSCDAWLQLTIPELEYPRSDLPEHFRFIGTLLGSNDRKGLPDWYRSFVVEGDASTPLVVATCGTIPGTPASDLLIPVIEACRSLCVRLVVCTVHATLPPSYKVPPNTRVASWLPFETLLPHASVVVSNGGFGGITQAFAAGVPMVVAGVTEEKVETTARAEMSGAAINLKTKTPEASVLRDAIEEVLAEKTFKEKAIELKRAFEAYDAVGKVEECVAEMVERFYD